MESFFFSTSADMSSTQESLRTAPACGVVAYEQSENLFSNPPSVYSMEWDDSIEFQQYVDDDDVLQQRMKDFEEGSFDEVTSFIPPEMGSDGWPELDPGQTQVEWPDIESELDTPQRTCTARVSGNTFHISFDEEEAPKDDIEIPMNWDQYRRVTAEYRSKSLFFDRWFKQQEDIRTQEEFLEVWNEHMETVRRYVSANGRMSFPERASVKFWDYTLFAYRKARNDLKEHFENRVLKAQSEVREDEAQQEVNTTFVNQRETVSDTGFIAQQVSTTGQGLSMPEKEYHVRTVMAKPILAASVAWTTSQEQGATIMEVTLPGGFINGPHRNLMSTFIFARTTMEITVQINSNKFNKGILVAAFAPLFKDMEKLGQWIWSGNLIALPHGRIDASLSNTVKLRIPFAHTHTYFNSTQTDPHAYLGRFVLNVFNRLGSTTGASSTVDVSIWVAFTDCELHQPSHAHSPTFPGDTFAEAGVEGLVKSVAPMLTDLYPAATSIAGNVLGAAADCDKPTDPVDIQRWVPNTVTALNYGEGIDRSQRMSLKPGTATLHTATIIQTTRDDMDLKQLCKIESRIATFTVSTGQGPGTMIGQLPVYPTLAVNKRENNTPEVPVDVFAVPVLAYCSRPFKYWRGGLKYTFIAAANAMMSMRIQITYIPGFHTTDFDTSKYFSNIYWDIQEKHEISFITPYMNTRPWSRCDQVLALADFQTPRMDLASGTLIIHVVNRLTVPDSSPASIDISVLVSGADDFELAFPSDLSVYQGSGDVIAQAEVSATISTREEDTAQVITYGGGFLEPAAATTLSENAMNLKTTCRRYYKVYENVITVNERSVLSHVNSPTLSSVNKRFNNNVGMQCRTMQAHFAEAFTFWRGSLRYAFVIHRYDTKQDITVNIFHIPGIFHNQFTPADLTDPTQNALASMEAAGVMVGNTSIQGSFQYEIPFYTPFQQLKTTIENDSSATGWTARSATGTVYIILNGTSNTKCRVELYQAIGDDFSFNYFRSVPQIQFQKLAEGARQLDDGAGWLYSESFMPFPVPSGAKTEDKPAEVKAECGVEETEDTQTQTETQAESIVSSIKQSLPRNPYTVAMDAMEDVRNTTHNLNNILHQIRQRMEPAPEEPAEELGFLEKILSDLPGMLGCGVKVVGSIAALVSGFQAFLTAETHFVKACAIVTVVREFFGNLVTWTVEKLTQMAMSIVGALIGNGPKQGNQGPVAQADIVEFIPMVVGVATAALVVFGFKSIPDDKDTKAICNNISDKLKLFNFGSSAISNVKSLYKEMKEFTEWIIEQILSLAAPEYLARLRLERGFEEVEQWAQFIELAEQTDYVNRANYDNEFRNEVNRCGDQAVRYNNLLLTGKIGREATVVRGYVQRAFRMVEETRTAYQKLPVRVDPICICMYGTTAMGKSAAMTQLGFEIMDRLGYPQEDRWVAHNATEKFFTELYKNQEAVYIDDISLFKDAEQYKNFANLKANTALPLNMAFTKGKMFTSHFIFTTTNVKYPTLNDCNENSALQRRRNILIQPRWRNQEIRDRVMRDGENDLRRNCAHLQFKIIPSIDPELAQQLRIAQAPPTRWMDYAELVEELTVRSRVYLQGQFQFLQENLERMHYPIPPEVQRLAAQIDPPVEEFHDAAEEVEAVVAAVPAEEDGDIVGDAQDEALAHQQALPLLVGPPPEAQVGNMDLEKAHTCRNLGTFSDEFLNTLYWDEESNSVKSTIAITENCEESDDEIEATNFNAMVVRQRLFAPRRIEHFMGIAERVVVLSEVEEEFLQCTQTSFLKRTLASVVEKLQKVKAYLKGLWQTAKETLPILSIFESFPAKMVAVTVAILGIGGLAAKVVHKCYCHSVRCMGYRCRVCGRWPVLDHSLNRAWILQEWQRMYGTEEYQPGRVTTLEEEATFFKAEDGQELEKIWIGTKECCAAQVGPYSDITRGSALKQVVPHLGPYSDITRGSAQTRVVAHTRVEEILEGRVYSALHRVRCVIGMNQVAQNAVAIGGKKFLITKHFMTLVERVGQMEILHSSKWVPVLYEEDRCKEFPGKDLVIVEIPSVQNVRSLVGHFIEEKALAKFKKTEAAVVRVDKKGVPTVMLTTATAIDEQKYTLDVAGKVDSYLTRGIWKYRAPMGPGTCGSVLVTTENKSNGIILGLHVAGDQRENAYAVLITKEMVETAISEGKLGTPLPKAQFMVSPLIPDGHFGHIGKVEKGVFQSDKTTIIPTAIQGLVAPVKTAPAALSSKDTRIKKDVNIIKECISKYGQVSQPFNLRHRAMISEDLREEFHRWKIARRPQVLTNEEALCGIDSLEGFDRLPLSTSPGYPWVLSRPIGETGKAYLFDIDNKKISDPDLNKAFEARERMARLGERVESVWTCCLKDERRSFEKIEQGNTRMFVIPPVDYSLLERKYMLDYSVALKDNRHVSSSKVGIDPQSLEWTELYNYIAEFSEFVFAGDFKQFDGTLASDLTADFYADADAFYQLFGDWNEGDRKVRAVLSDEGIHTVCLANSVCFMTHIGNKSGNPNTVNKNGDVNARYMKLAYLGLAEENGKLATMAEFHKHARLAVYGDDNIVAVKPEVLDWFNQVTVTEFLKRYGIVYTNATKEGEIKPYIGLREMTFLKQSFRDHEGIKDIKVPHMAEQTITELTNWTRVAPDQDELLESNCNDALRFAYFRGFDYFNTLRVKIMKALSSRQKALRIMTYTDYHFWFLHVCGMLPCRVRAELALEQIAHSGNSKGAREILRLISCLPYAILSKTGLLGRDDKKDKTDSRYAIAIPSGEGKSWLCERYPGLFVDHDDILLPEAERRLKEKGLDWEYLWGMTDVDLPINDRRVLLVHHPGNTRRKVLGCFKLPKPCFIRANAYQRLRLKNATVLERDQRNKEILKLIAANETALWNANGKPQVA